MRASKIISVRVERERLWNEMFSKLCEEIAQSFIDEVFTGVGYYQLPDLLEPKRLSDFEKTPIAKAVASEPVQEQQP